MTPYAMEAIGNHITHDCLVCFCGCFCYSFTHFNSLEVHEAPGVLRNVLAPCYVASSAHHYTHVQPSALDLQGLCITCGPLKGDWNTLAHRFLHQRYYSLYNIAFTCWIRTGHGVMEDPSARAS